MTKLMSHPRKHSKKKCMALGACLIFVALVVITRVAADNNDLKKHHNKDNDGGPNAFSITDICSTTLYPDVCNSTLPGSDTSNLQKCVVIAMKTAVVAMTKSVEEVQELKSSSPVKNGTQYSTLEMCEEVLTDGLEEVKTSLSRISNLNRQSLKSKLFDIQQDMSAAVTDQDTCLTGVQEFGVWNASDALNRTHSALVTMLLSNAVALVNSLAEIID